MIGAPDRARVALERGARVFRPEPAPVGAAASVAAAACLGQLAWQEAVAGQLTSALRHAASVLTARPADSNESGVIHAQLATTWCQISRDELERAVQRFQGVNSRRSFPTDGALMPELAMATGLVAARLAAAIGHGSTECDQVPRSLPCARQYERQLSLIRAELELDAGQPSAALQLLADASEHGAEVQALRARAWIQLGDLAAVGASLRARPAEALGLLPRLQIDLIESWLAPAHGDRIRQRALIDRVLRIAGREQLRAPIAWAKPWLREVIASDSVLLQRHGPFLASIRTIRPGALDSTLRPAPVATPVSDLTEREIDILQRLGALSTNEPRDRRRPVPLAEHRQDAPEVVVPQARGDPALRGVPSGPGPRSVLQDTPRSRAGDPGLCCNPEAVLEIPGAVLEIPELCWRSWVWGTGVLSPVRPAAYGRRARSPLR